MADSDVLVKFIHKSDFTQVLRIEQRSFEEPWDETRLRSFMDDWGNFGMVAKRGRIVDGYVFYQVRKGLVRLINLAVDFPRRRVGVGQQMLGTIMSELTQRRSRIIAEVSDSNLEAHLFLRDCGFTGSVSGQDLYKFEYDLKAGVLR